jgi:cytochrome P450 family 135
MPALRRDLGAWSPWGRFVRARDVVDSLIYELIDEQRAAPGSRCPPGILPAIVATADKQGCGLDRKEIRDHIVTVLIAGLETTSTALAWTFYELARHPGAQERARAERAHGEYAFVKAIVTESLRLHPPVLVGPVPMVTREITLQGYRIPAGTFVTPGTTLIHRDPGNYPEPDSFLPDRFIAASPPPHRYFPFGWGPHRCLGANLATIEMERVVGTVLDMVRLAPATAKPERGVIRYVTCAPGNGARVVATRVRLPLSRSRYRGGPGPDPCPACLVQ